MSTQPSIPKHARRSEAERLIALARAMLTDRSDEIAIIYLDQASDALRAASDEADPQTVRAA